MSDHLQLTSGRDDPITGALRRLYAPPSGEAYWDGLEREIMARVTGSSGTAAWWGAFANWVPVGLAAAGLAAVLSGLAIRSARVAEARVAYEAVVQTSPLLPARTPPSASPATEREATFRYLVTY